MKRYRVDVTAYYPRIEWVERFDNLTLVVEYVEKLPVINPQNLIYVSVHDHQAKGKLMEYLQGEIALFSSAQGWGYNISAFDWQMRLVGSAEQRDWLDWHES